MYKRAVLEYMYVCKVFLAPNMHVHKVFLTLNIDTRCIRGHMHVCKVFLAPNMHVHKVFSTLNMDTRCIRGHMHVCKVFLAPNRTTRLLGKIFFYQVPYKRGRKELLVGGIDGRILQQDLRTSLRTQYTVLESRFLDTCPCFCRPVATWT